MKGLSLRIPPVLGLLATTLVLTCSAQSARANVYATNIKLNEGLTNTWVVPGSSINISYVLNEPASRGVTVDILSGSTVVRSFSLAAGAPGSLRGPNSVVWDGRNESGNAVRTGTYSVSITAAADGYTNWTQITADSNPANHVSYPRSVTVNRNTNSPFYGRVFIANSAPGANPGSVTGDRVGIIKLNADASYADEGAVGTGGWPWLGDFYSPWKVRCEEDDQLYVSDFTSSGEIIAFDQVVSPAHRVVLDTYSYELNPFIDTVQWSAFEVSGLGTTNPLVWLGDTYYFGGGNAGIWCWAMTNGVANPDDYTGTQVIESGGDLLSTWSIAVDRNSNIYVSQDRSANNDPYSRAMMFSYTNWNGSTPLRTATWAVGQGENSFRGAVDVELDAPEPKYCAFALSRGAGGARILNAANGTWVADVSTNGLCRAVGWDNVGNLYLAISPSGSPTGLWRAFSPPGANQATTVAAQTVLIAQRPHITGITALAGGAGVAIRFTGSDSDTPDAFAIMSAAAPAGAYTVAAQVVVTQVTPGLFEAVVPLNGAMQFYRVAR